MITDSTANAVDPSIGAPIDGGLGVSGGVGEEPRPEPSEARKAIVKQWLERIVDAEKKWEPDFKKMSKNMEFAAGRQWEEDGSAEGSETSRYVANVTVRNVAQKVSSLYARDPKAVARRRIRKDFTLWDGKVESLAAAFQKVQAAMSQMQPPDPNAMALLNDYQHGKALQQQIDSIGETLEIVYQWQVDQQEPEFKKQMKQLVRRVVTCCVGYVKLTLETGDAPPISGDGVESSPSTIMRTMQSLMQEMTEDGAGPDDPRVEQMKNLLLGLHGPQEAPGAPERLVFAFPSSTSIIPDKKCRCLKDFVGADFVAEKYKRPLSEVNAYFEVDIELTAEIQAATERENARALSPDDKTHDPLVELYEVYDKKTKTRFFLCKGHDDYVLAPEPISPPTKRFWPWFSLCFNDVEVEDDLKVSIFPPSDVELIAPAQREWNRCRDALRDHRTGSIPFFISTVPLSTDDKKRLQGINANDVIELQGLPPGTDAAKVLVAFNPAQLNPQVYDTSPIQQDILMTSGMQEANVGPTTGATATESSIAEQSRLSHASSNVDDLDDLLSDVARAGGELLLRGMSEQSVKAIAGVGAVWPPANEVENYVNDVFLEIEAASSGRPNRALDENKFKVAAPLLLQAGANPKAIIEWGKKTLDINVPLEDLFPLAAPSSQPPPPKENISINYKDAPDDIKRQMEEAAGFGPSKAPAKNANASVASSRPEEQNTHPAPGSGVGTSQQ